MFANTLVRKRWTRSWVVCIWMLVFLLLGVQSTQAQGSVLYAAPETQGTGDCSSWDNACTLQTALAQAASGDEIWVKAGVYYPGGEGERTASFALKNGVALYGGFAGTETSRDQRDWQANLTILSGDIDRNDINDDGNFIAETWNALQGENAYHVVTASNVDHTAVLDGFIITAGQANFSGVYPYDFYGGGLYSETNGSPTLSNLIFRGNFASKLGGGIYNGSSSNPVLTNVVFRSNRAELGGGGMANDGQSSPTLEWVVFEGNVADVPGGGAVYNMSSSPEMRNTIFRGNTAVKGGGIFNDTSSAPVLKNVLFVDNHASSEGGGIYSQNSSDMHLVNVTFSNNQAGSQGGALANYQSNPTIENSILCGNEAPDSPELYNYFGTPTISYSLIAGGYEGEGNLDADPLFVDRENGDLHLGEGSPAIDTGNTSAISEATDLDGNSRVQDGNKDDNAVVDMGAYEAPPDMNHPGVVSITRADPNPTNATSVRFAVRFSEPVTGVDEGDFTLRVSGGITGASIGSVSGGPAIVYFVTVLTGEGEGTLGLDLNGAGTEIQDLAGNPISGGWTGDEDYTIDRTHPEVISITRLDTSPTSATSVRFGVAFSEPVAGVDVSDFLLTATVTEAQVLQVASEDQIVYTVTVDTGTGNGTLRLDIPESAAITDLAGNPLAGLPYESGEVYTINKPVPHLIAPANGAVLPNRRPFFDWRNFSGASAYQLQIARNSTFTLGVVKVGAVSSQYQWSADLLPKTTYYWRVRAKVGAVYTGWSDVWSFTTGNPPSIPVLSSPASNALVGTLPTFRWGKVTVPAGTVFDRYEIQIATDAAFSSPLVGYTPAGELTAVQYTPAEPLEHGTKYYWRVRAWNTAGEYSSWSAVRTVRVKYAAPVLQTPVNGATNLQPEFAWEAIAGATSYTLQVSRNEAFTSLVISKTVVGTRYNHPVNLPVGRYYWRVWANGAFGPGEKSEVRWFEAGLATSVPVLALPANGALVGPMPVFDWANVTLPVGAAFDKYEIQIAADAAFTSPLIGFTAVGDVAASQYTPAEPLERATKYYWRVRAWTTAGVNSTWSAVRTVRVQYAAPTNAQVSVTDKKPTFQWDAVVGATSYTLQVSKSATFGTLLINRTQSGTSYTYTALASGTYYWRVRANGAFGPGEWYSGSFVVP